MAATTAASVPRVKYAPDDPSLPKPWRGLVDSKTGYLYFWNPETNVTQYERPVAPPESLHDEVASEHHSKNNAEVTYNKGSEDADARNEGGEDACKEVSEDGYKKVSDDGYDKGCDDAYNKGSGDGYGNLSEGAYNKGSDNGPEKVDLEDGSCQTASGGPDYSVNSPDVKTNSASGPYASKGVETGVSAEAYRQRHEITVTGNNVPQPFMSFQTTSFPPEILREIKNAGFAAPTPIQAQSWPIALQGRDIVAIAKTGSGKTLGYLIPGFLHLKQKHSNPKLGPTVLVLSPTRELATQIQDETVKFGKSSRISCTCLYGGAPKGPQLKDLDRGVDVVVATPGRLNDILEMKRVSLHQVSYLVLDEADRMLDMGFEPQIRKIVKEVPSRRQTLMYTATWPKEVRRIAADLLVNPVQVNIGNVDELAANKAITQYVEVLQSMDKRRRVEQILRSQEPGSKIIIFCSTKKMCDMLAGNLNRPFGAAAIHGDKSQGERDHVLNQFKTGRSPVLVATDVAARGLDIKDIRVVINYDFPTGIEDYVHRIGRTGRAGATGLAYTFFSSNDERHASDLIKLLERADQNVPAELREMGMRGGGMGRSFRRWSSGSSGNDGGYGGNYNSSSSYNPSSGGRGNGTSGGRGMPSSPDQGHQQQNSHGFGSSEDNNTDASGGSQHMSFHERMMAAGKNGCNTRRSPVRNSGWGENQSRERSRSPSPSVGGFDGAAAPARRSFHETMMQRARPSPALSTDKQQVPQDGNGNSFSGW